MNQTGILLKVQNEQEVKSEWIKVRLAMKGKRNNCQPSGETSAKERKQESDIAEEQINPFV